MLFLAFLVLGHGAALDPASVPKFAHTLPLVPIATPSSTDHYTLTMTTVDAQMLPPPLPPTPAWAYVSNAQDRVTGAPLGLQPWPEVRVQRGQSVNVTYVHNITTELLVAVDPTLHWANPLGLARPEPPFAASYPQALSPVALVPHLHGAETASASDGYPTAWWTRDGLRGPAYASEGGVSAPDAATYRYPNAQGPLSTWLHDHALGLTRLHVHAGLATPYTILDAAHAVEATLPQGAYDLSLMLADRAFNADGTLAFRADGVVPGVHPLWRSHFAGDVITVNNKVWPELAVHRGAYVLRLVNAANARYFDLSLAVNNVLATRLSLTVLGSDGGYLRSAASRLTLLLAPAERAVVLVDFSGLAAGTPVVLRNTAALPYPGGAAPDAATTGTVMRFVVQAAAGSPAPSLPATLNAALTVFPSLPAPSKRRVLTLYDEPATLAQLLNGQHWMAPVTELAVLGTTEEWTLVNLTPAAHPIHLHLVHFQLVERRSLDAAQYRAAWLLLNGPSPYNSTVNEVDPAPYLVGAPSGPAPEEQGWKDTLNVLPSQAVRLRVRFAPANGAATFPFDATAGPGYVWQ